MPENNIGKRLKELRLQAGLTQKQAYEHVGVAQSTFSSWEIGKAEPPVDVLLKLCRLYRVDDVLSAFGYNGYNSDGSIQLNIMEINFIEKYRRLDAHGKKMVDFVLNEEYDRALDISIHEAIRAANDIELEPYEVLQAAHENAEGATEEQKKHADDIMMDDSEWE